MVGKLGSVTWVSIKQDDRTLSEFSILGRPFLEEVVCEAMCTRSCTYSLDRVFMLARTWVSDLRDDEHHERIKRPCIDLGSNRRRSPSKSLRPHFLQRRSNSSGGGSICIAFGSITQFIHTPIKHSLGNSYSLA